LSILANIAKLLLTRREITSLRALRLRSRQPSMES
jgi:hypothetical protein